MSTMYSGGARGADSLWGNVAHEAGYRVVHYIFKEHKHDMRHLVKGSFRVLSQEQLTAAQEHVDYANNTLRRSINSGSEYMKNLLRRSWYVINGEKDNSPLMLYAVGNLDLHGIPLGGTAWAVAMWLQKWGAQAPAYFYKQQLNRQGQWYQLKSWDDIDFTWREIDRPPKPNVNFVAVGTRALLEDGMRAIKEVLK